MSKPESSWLLFAPVVFNYLLLKVGTIWLRTYIFLSRGGEADSVFNSAWQSAGRLSYLFRQAEFCKNPNGYHWREMLFLRILDEMRRVQLTYVPRFQIGADDVDLLLSKTKGPAPVIVVTTHSPVDATLNRVYRQNGIEFSVLATGPGVIAKAELLGFIGKLDVTVSSKDSLLIMRRKLAERKLISACVDHSVPRAGTPLSDVFISPAMFELAVRTGASVIYAWTTVSDEGIILLSFGAPDDGLNSPSAEALGNDFIGWLRSEQGDRRRWRLQNRTQRASSRSRIFAFVEKSALD